MTATAAILRAAADRLDHHQVANPVAAVRLAAHALTGNGGDHATDEALTALAAHLRYGADRDPRRVLARWSSMRTPEQMADQLREAANALEGA